MMPMRIKKRNYDWYSASRRFFGSEIFWRCSLVLFTVQALYIASVGRFSMAFDEHFHLAAIQAYAKTWLPWQVQQPAGPAELGALTADGSYLYHYLMSFPYRLLDLFVHDQTVQIIVLRLLDVGVVVVGWFLFRKLLFVLKTSRPAAHSILALIMLMPMAPFLAGQLTYDTLFFTLCAASVLLAVRLVRRIDEHTELPLGQTALTLGVVLVTCQVKYAFLPAAFGMIAFMTIYVGWKIWRGQLVARVIASSWAEDMQRSGSIFAIGVLMLAGMLFAQRYGMNYLQYGALVPDCNKVIGHQRCLDFDPYGRDADIHERGWHRTITISQKFSYPNTWYQKMIRESYFSVGPREINYPSVQPLPVAYAAGKILALVSVVLLAIGLVYVRKISAVEGLLFATLTGYVGALLAKNYAAFLFTAVPLSIHGRYVLPFLPLAGYLVYKTLTKLRLGVAWRTGAFLFVGILLMAHLYGGGIAPFIIGSNDQWYWPHAVPTSRIVRSVLWPLILK